MFIEKVIDRLHCFVSLDTPLVHIGCDFAMKAVKIGPLSVVWCWVRSLLFTVTVLALFSRTSFGV